MNHLVSILIPAFNAARWIRDCIESALHQTWPHKEIIIVDDGSKDSTLQIAKSYASANVLVASQDNMGASAARNHALALSQGDYIQWLDADDLLARDKVAWQLRGAEPGHNARVLISGAWGRFYYCPERSKFAPNSLWQDLVPFEWLFRQADENLWMAIDSWLVSRKLTELAGQWNEKLTLNDDGDYFCRVVSHAERIRFIQEAKCYVRRGNPGLSSIKIRSTGKQDSQAASIISNIRMLRAIEDSERVRTACLKLLQRWSVHVYPERHDIMSEIALLASDLGGQIHPPVLKLKYRLLQKAFGWKITKKAQLLLPALRSIPEKEWDRMIYLLTALK